MEWAGSRALLQHLALPSAASRSLTHAASHAAVVVASPSCTTGIDLEAVRPRNVRRLAQLCYADEESEPGADASGSGNLREFYIRWTLKEAFAKALGLPLARALRQCCFWPGDGGWHGRVPTGSRWRAAVYEPRTGLMLAVALTGECVPDAGGWTLQEWPPGHVASWPVVAALSAGAR